jgi:hypothetical protein
MRGAVVGSDDRGRGGVGGNGGPSRKEHGSRRVARVVCEERVLVPYILVKIDRRGEGRRKEGKSKAEWGRWTEERCMWRANEKERAQGAGTKETQSGMEGKYGGRAQRNRGRGTERYTTRARITKGSGWWRGKDGATANEKTGSLVDKNRGVRDATAREERRRVDHGQAEQCRAVREGIRRKGRGRVDDESVYERRATSPSLLQWRK